MAGPDPAAQAFIVGAQRCGTTSVATALERHPQVVLAQPRRPEPKFFLRPGADADVNAYLARHFPDVGPDIRLRCEKSTSYLESDVACAQIGVAFPDARILVVLRDPVERALSHYRFSREQGVEDWPVEAALDPEAETRPWDTDAISVSPYRYLSRGRYVDDLRRWLETFGREAVQVIILEDLIAEPERFADVEAALGLDPGPAFAVHERHNAGEDEVVLDDGTRARLVAWFADANADLAEELGRPIDRWAHA
ncbi:MAG: sulfotransferase [Acidimicrobiales bacterium]